MGIVRLLPSQNEAAYELEEASEARDRQKQQPVSEIVELDKPVNTDEPQNKEDGGTVKSEMEFRGLDHADSLGLILISCRAKYLVNWLVNALMSLNHPNSENALPLVTIYGPKDQVKKLSSASQGASPCIAQYLKLEV
ncbi:hypothetical protein ACET3Z_000563 [Daucus carota]